MLASLPSLARSFWPSILGHRSSAVLLSVLREMNARRITSHETHYTLTGRMTAYSEAIHLDVLTRYP